MANLINDQITCGQCGYAWTPRHNPMPKACPSCKRSPYRDKPRKQRQAAPLLRALLGEILNG